MKVFIIEDEFAAQANLRQLLTTNCPDVEIVGVVDAVSAAVDWLRQNETDIIFMDVELSDGTCFEIFKRIDITAKVIITTAYDTYAIQAFQQHCVDYLLKPIDPELLVKAMNHCRENQEQRSNKEIFGHFYSEREGNSPVAYKQRLMVRLGDKLIIVKVQDIAYFYSKEKTSYLITFEGKNYIVDYSLDMLETMLDPSDFFRVNRGCLMNVNSIQVVSRHLSGRLRLQVAPPFPIDEEIFVSRVRTNDFLVWINQ
ncbi:MAG: LytTR family DNA-binding domain-containing protein [Bacteroidales bacterium]|nr:LytTR family DNA-binding domain-containing protein [Bacteroidales bacterium]